jgi:uncharacterized surface protein with fasciclin (FAS1) repeats
MPNSKKIAIVALASALSGAVALAGAKTASATRTPVGKTIVQTASGAGSFDTLVAALKAADLVSTLDGPGPFTVFAPTDEAFAKLPKGTVENLLKPENKAQLQALLTYHVVPGNVMAADVVKLNEARTANGASLPIVVAGNTVKVDEAKVVQTDIVCSNGVIHVIDRVVMP